MTNPLPFNPATLTVSQIIRIVDEVSTLFTVMDRAPGDDERIATAARMVRNAIARQLNGEY